MTKEESKDQHTFFFGLQQSRHGGVLQTNRGLLGNEKPSGYTRLSRQKLQKLVEMFRQLQHRGLLYARRGLAFERGQPAGKLARYKSRPFQGAEWFVAG